MIERLVVFGDSFSFGQGLDGTNIAYQTPSPLAWPNKLAELLGVPVVNCSWPGSSNKMINWTALNFPMLSTDLVVFCWSCPQRHTVIKDLLYKKSETYMQYHHILNVSSTKNYGTWLEDDPVVMNYYGGVYDDTDAIIDTLKLIQYSDLYTKQFTPYCLQTTIPQMGDLDQLCTQDEKYTVNPDHAFLSESPEWFSTEIVATMSYEKFNVGQSDDGHLNLEASDHFANRLYQLLTARHII